MTNIMTNLCQGVIACQNKTDYSAIKDRMFFIKQAVVNALHYMIIRKKIFLSKGNVCYSIDFVGSTVGWEWDSTDLK